MNILLINIQGLFGEGLKRLFRDVGGSLEFTATQGRESSIQCLTSTQYDLVVLDLDSMETTEVGPTLRALVQQAGRCPVVVLSGSESKFIMRAVLEYGVRGYICKGATPAVFANAIRVVLSGRIYRSGDNITGGMPVQISRPAVDEKSGVDVTLLTPRQLDVLRELAQGKPNKLIARDLDVSENTVKTHVSAVFRILGARNRTDAVCQATRLQLVLNPGYLDAAA